MPVCKPILYSDLGQILSPLTPAWFWLNLAPCDRNAHSDAAIAAFMLASTPTTRDLDTKIQPTGEKLGLSPHNTDPALSGYWEVSDDAIANNTFINSR